MRPYLYQEAPGGAGGIVLDAWESWETISFSWVRGVFKEDLGLARAGGGCWLVKEVVVGISKPMSA